MDTRHLHAHTHTRFLYTIREHTNYEFNGKLFTKGEHSTRVHVTPQETFEHRTERVYNWYVKLVKFVSAGFRVSMQLVQLTSVESISGIINFLRYLLDRQG